MTDHAHDAGTAKEALLQQVASDFLSSYSEFLNAASLLERRPKSHAIHPDTNRSLTAARWLLTRAIGGLDRIAPPARSAAGHSDRKATGSLPPIVTRAIEGKILTRWPDAERLLSDLPAPYGLTDLIPPLRRELSICLAAVSCVDVQSGSLSWQLHAALSKFTDAMVKGQFVAIGRLEEAH
jgi:hypothetical protein